MQSQKTVWRVGLNETVGLTFVVWAGRLLPIKIRCSLKCSGETELIEVEPLYANHPIDIGGTCQKCHEVISAKVEFINSKTMDSPRAISDFPHLCSAFEVEDGGRIDLCYQLNVPNPLPVLVTCPDCGELTAVEVRSTAAREDNYEVLCRKCGKKLKFVANFYE